VDDVKELTGSDKRLDAMSDKTTTLHIMNGTA
jgi:hypothetical protein